MLSTKRLSHIDLLESIAIFFVLFYHGTLYSYDFLQHNIVTNYLLYFSRTILSVCAPLFFFVNGYLLLNKQFDLKKHIKKTVRLVVLTFIWAFLLMPIYLLIAGKPLNMETIRLAVLNLDVHWRMNYFWFIGSLVCIYILFPALKAMFDKSKASFIFFTVICAIVTFGLVLANQVLSFIGPLTRHYLGDLCYPAIVMFNPFNGIYGYTFVYFCIGGLIYSYEGRILSVKKSKRNLISVFGIIISSACLFLVGVYYSRYRDECIWDVVWNGYDTVFTFFNVLFVYTLSLNYTASNSFIENVSCNTLGIYFIHGLFQQLTYPWVASHAILCNLPANAIYALLVLCLCLSACLIFKKLPILKNLI